MSNHTHMNQNRCMKGQKGGDEQAVGCSKGYCALLRYRASISAASTNPGVGTPRARRLRAVAAALGTGLHRKASARPIRAKGEKKMVYEDAKNMKRANGKRRRRCIPSYSWWRRRIKSPLRIRASGIHGELQEKRLTFFGF